MKTRTHCALHWKFQRITLSLLIVLTPVSVSAQQQEEVFTFKGQGGSPIKILNEKGEVQEEVRESDLKSIIVKPKLYIPQRAEQPQNVRRHPQNRTKKSVKSNKSLDELLNERRKKLRRSTAYLNRPPRKRR